MATYLGKFIGRALVKASKGPKDAEPDRKPKPSFSRKKKKPKNYNHDLGEVNEGYRCWPCCKRAPTTESFQKIKCSKKDCHDHTLWQAGPVIFCSRCGAYSRKRVQKLGLPCTGHGNNNLKKELMQGRLLGTYLGEPQLLRKPTDVGGCLLKNKSIDVGRNIGEVVDDFNTDLGECTKHVAEPTIFDLGTTDEEGDPETSWCEVLNQIF